MKCIPGARLPMSSKAEVLIQSMLTNQKTSQNIKRFNAYRMQQSSNTGKFSLQKGVHLSNVLVNHNQENPNHIKAFLSHQQYLIFIVNDDNLSITRPEVSF